MSLKLIWKQTVNGLYLLHSQWSRYESMAFWREFSHFLWLDPPCWREQTLHQRTPTSEPSHMICKCKNNKTPNFDLMNQFNQWSCIIPSSVKTDSYFMRTPNANFDTKMLFLQGMLCRGWAHFNWMRIIDCVISHIIKGLGVITSCTSPFMHFINHACTWLLCTLWSNGKATECVQSYGASVRNGWLDGFIESISRLV